MTLTTPKEQLTPREYAEQEHEKTMFDKQAEYNIEIKKLELEATKLEAKFSSWLKIPITIIKLPLLIILGISYCIAVAKNKELSENFWDYLK